MGTTRELEDSFLTFINIITLEEMKDKTMDRNYFPTKAFLNKLRGL